MSDFRERLAKATEELGGDPSRAENTPVEDFKQVIEDSISFIAGIDFLHAMDSRLITPQYIEILSIWIATGAVEGAGRRIKVLRKAYILDTSNLKTVLDADVSADYLQSCFDAGIKDFETIAEGWKSGLPLDYLTVLASSK